MTVTRVISGEEFCFRVPARSCMHADHVGVKHSELHHCVIAVGFRFSFCDTAREVSRILNLTEHCTTLEIAGHI